MDLDDLNAFFGNDQWIVYLTGLVALLTMVWGLYVSVVGSIRKRRTRAETERAVAIHQRNRRLDTDVAKDVLARVRRRMPKREGGDAFWNDLYTALAEERRANQVRDIDAGSD